MTYLANIAATEAIESRRTGVYNREIRNSAIDTDLIQRSHSYSIIVLTTRHFSL